MPTKTFNVELRGLDELKAKLQTKRLFGPIKQEIIKHAATQGRKRAEDESKGRHGTKGFKGRMETDFEQDGLVARVRPQRSISGIAFTVNQGRRPGNISLKRFAPWAQRAGIQVYRSEGRKRYTAEYVAIRDRIRSSGTKPVGFMEKGEEAANKAIRDGIPKAERGVKHEWDR